MEQLVFNNAQEVQQAYNTGDREKDLAIVNAVLTGNVAIKTDEQPIEKQVEPQPTETPSATTDVTTEQQIENPIEDPIEKEKAYAELVKEQYEIEKARLLEETAKKNKEIEDYKKAKEELEERLRMASTNIQQAQPTTETQVDEEEEFASEYAKKTRKMLEELRSQVGNNPKVQEIAEEFDVIKSEYERRRTEDEQKRQEKERKDREDKAFNTIRDFQLKHPELKTEKDIKELDNEYTRFRNDIAHLTKARTLADVEKAIKDYFSGGEVRKLADSRGVPEMVDYNKYSEIANLVDMKNGIMFDPITGKEIPIVDDDGVRVRYRSIDEAYRVRNFDNELVNAKKSAYKEIGEKLNKFESAPPVLKPEQTDQFTTGYTIEQEREILSWNPDQWVNNPEKRRMVQEVYAKRGLEVPRYRGRR